MLLLLSFYVLYGFYIDVCFYLLLFLLFIVYVFKYYVLYFLFFFYFLCGSDRSVV